MNPLSLVLIIAGIVCALCWILSLVTADTSWVDRIWSIVPVAYVWVFAVMSPPQGQAALIMVAILVTLWGLRLTLNFARKGGYTGMEDYRWQVLRDRLSKGQFQLFNLLFIVLYQNALLVLITLPAYVMWQNPGPITGFQVFWAVLFLGALLGETVADQQQWNFHQAKKAAGGKLDPGFCTTGLFRFSRHPNFFFEQSQWWMVYAIGATAVAHTGVIGGIINWSIIGPVLLSLLFIGSTKFTEWITAGKYPAYADYKRTTSMLIPLPPRGSSRKATA